ncbi:2862_t:CDS:2, partial [Ambispora gerdemannii]
RRELEALLKKNITTKRTIIEGGGYTTTTSSSSATSQASQVALLASMSEQERIKYLATLSLTERRELEALLKNNTTTIKQTTTTTYYDDDPNIPGPERVEVTTTEDITTDAETKIITPESEDLETTGATETFITTSSGSGVKVGY